MTSKDDPPKASDPSAGSGQALRKRAEKIVRKKAAQSPENPEALSPEETRRTLYELRVHQIELEMQNEELRRTQLELDAARARYFDLYDLAPVGYCTLSEQGLILETNLTAAALLGVPRGALVKQPITRFILKEDQNIYYLHRKHLFETHSASSGQAGEPQVCELRMVKKDGTAFWTRLEATAAQNDDGAMVCRTVMSDITERKEAEEKIRASLKEKEVLLKEIHHRVKNNLQIVSSLLYLQSARTEHPEAVSALDESRNRVRAMALIHERLYQSPNLASVDMGKYTRNLVSDLWHSYRAEDGLVRLTFNVEDIPLGITEAIPCGLIINELVSNALKHAFPKGRGFHGVACGNLSSEHGEPGTRLRVREAHTALPGEGATRVPVVAGEITIQLLKEGASHITLTVSDNGTGFPESLDFRKSPSLGLTLISSLVEQLHGTIELDRRGGTAFTITFKVSG
jgi:PAS domain S-box-containing protein